LSQVRRSRQLVASCQRRRPSATRSWWRGLRAATELRSRRSSTTRARMWGRGRERIDRHSYTCRPDPALLDVRASQVSRNLSSRCRVYARPAAGRHQGRGRRLPRRTRRLACRRSRDLHHRLTPVRASVGNLPGPADCQLDHGPSGPPAPRASRKLKRPVPEVGSVHAAQAMTLKVLGRSNQAVIHTGRVVLAG
jgi:hypothetical protein